MPSLIPGMAVPTCSLIRCVLLPPRGAPRGGHSQEVALGNEVKAEGRFQELWDRPQPASPSMVGLTRCV